MTKSDRKDLETLRDAIAKLEGVKDAGFSSPAVRLAVRDLRDAERDIIDNERNRV